MAVMPRLFIYLWQFYIIKGTDYLCHQNIQMEKKEALLALAEKFAKCLGWSDAINLKDNPEMTGVISPTTPLIFTAHAPLWGTKEGQEKEIDGKEVRKNLASMSTFVRIVRRDCYQGFHGLQLALFLHVEIRLKFFPFIPWKTSLVFLMTAVEEGGELFLKRCDEHAAKDVEEAKKLLNSIYGWPADTPFEKSAIKGLV